MSLAASVVVASMPLLGDVHLDGDVLGWRGLRGERQVVRVVQLHDGRPDRRQRELWSTRGSVELSDLDVAASGAAVACLRERSGRDDQTWRVRIVRRSPRGVWSKPQLVADPRRWVEFLTCGVGDAGQVALSWVESSTSRTRPVRAAFVAPDGTVEPPVTLATDPIGEPETVVAPDGTATVAYTLEPGRDRVLHLAHRPAAGGWASRPIAPAFGPHLASDGTGRALVGWSAWSESDDTQYFAAGPDFTPAPFVHERDSALGTLVGGPRGDVLAAWYTRASRGDGVLRVAVQRPGADFTAPALLGRFSAYPLLATLDAAGGGAVATIGGTERRRRPFARVLRPDGTWGARLKVTHDPARARARRPWTVRARDRAAGPLRQLPRPAGAHHRRVSARPSRWARPGQWRGWISCRRTRAGAPRTCRPRRTSGRWCRPRCTWSRSGTRRHAA